MNQESVVINTHPPFLPAYVPAWSRIESTKMLDKNWTPRLIKWLRLRDRPTLQVEALWALTNIAAGATDNTSVLLQNGVIPTLVSLLDSSNEEVQCTQLLHIHTLALMIQLRTYFIYLPDNNAGAGAIGVGAGQPGRRRLGHEGPGAQRRRAVAAREQPEEDADGPFVAAAHPHVDAQQPVRRPTAARVRHLDHPAVSGKGVFIYQKCFV